MQVSDAIQGAGNAAADNIRGAANDAAGKLKIVTAAVIDNIKSRFNKNNGANNHESINADSDISANVGPVNDEEIGNTTMDRFVYKPSGFAERIAVSVRVKNKLAQSRCVKIPYRVWCKYLLIVLLLLVGAFLTPQLIPKWLGFEWDSPKDLCRNKEQKMTYLLLRIENLTKLPELRAYNNQQKFDAQCMNESASQFYQTPERFEWPTECTPDKASESLQDEVCIGPNSRNICDNIGGVRRLFASLAQTCKTITVPKTCKTVVDSERTQALLELEREEKAQSLNATSVETQVIVETANAKATEIISRLMLQVDIASDVFILYSICSIIVGMPLVIYKREKGSQILGATFGMQKVNFIILVVVLLSFYDSFLVILKETDFPRFFRNLRNDPCYVDAEFSRGRVNIIIHACNNVTHLNLNSTAILQDMDWIYFTTRRFGICQDSSRAAAQHPRTTDMDFLRTRYRDGDLQFPGVCNATFLDEQTSTAPSDPEFSKLRALLGSGVLAQLLVKFVVTSWLVHLISFREPMVVHNGKVEIWDTSNREGGNGKQETPLNEREVQSAVRFARDKHLLPLIVLSMLMCLEMILIIYSIVVTSTGAEDLAWKAVEETRQDLKCPFAPI